MRVCTPCFVHSSLVNLLRYVREVDCRILTLLQLLDHLGFLLIVIKFDLVTVNSIPTEDFGAGDEDGELDSDITGFASDDEMRGGRRRAADEGRVDPAKKVRGDVCAAGDLASEVRNAVQASLQCG